MKLNNDHPINQFISSSRTFLIKRSCNCAQVLFNLEHLLLIHENELVQSALNQLCFKILVFIHLSINEIRFLKISSILYKFHTTRSFSFSFSLNMYSFLINLVLRIKFFSNIIGYSMKILYDALYIII